MIPNIKDQKTSPYPSSRRSASPKRDSDIAASKWPIITKAAYGAMLSRQDPQLNLKMKRLAMGRIRFGQLHLAISSAMHDHNPAVKGGDISTRTIYNKLRAIDRDVERLMLSYPLEVR